MLQLVQKIDGYAILHQISQIDNTGDFFLLALTQVVEGGPGEGAPALDVCPLLQAEI